MAIYVCGDVHGQYGLFMQMLRRIKFSDSDTLYVIGDLIDRGPNSVKLLQYVMSKPNIICMLGNHELMMYVHYKCPQRNDYWLNSSNGGIATKKQFDRLPEQEKEAILKYIKDMYLQIELEEGGKTFLLSHSDFIESEHTIKHCNRNYWEVFDTVWNSPWRYSEYVSPIKYKEDGRIHIIGHVPAQRIYYDGLDKVDETKKVNAYISDNGEIINIDLGCAWKSNPHDNIYGISLCCMNLSEYAKENKEKVFRYFT